MINQYAFFLHSVKVIDISARNRGHIIIDNHNHANTHCKIAENIVLIYIDFSEES